MRIGLVLDRFEPSRGGRERWTFAFAERLAAAGHEVHVVTRRLGEAELNRFKDLCRELNGRITPARLLLGSPQS